MTLRDFEDLKDYLLEENPYFDTGFANAFKIRSGEKAGWILAKKGNDLIAVAPQDTYGNYFYLRNDEGITLSPTVAVSPKYPAYTETIRMWVVCMLKQADAMLVANNIVNSISIYNSCTSTLRAQNINWNREQIIADELSGLKQEDIAAVMQRLSDWVIVRVQFNYSTIRNVSKCIVSPCEIC